MSTFTYAMSMRVYAHTCYYMQDVYNVYDVHDVYVARYHMHI